MGGAHPHAGHQRPGTAAPHLLCCLLPDMLLYNPGNIPPMSSDSGPRCYQACGASQLGPLRPMSMKCDSGAREAASVQGRAGWDITRALAAVRAQAKADGQMDSYHAAAAVADRVAEVPPVTLFVLGFVLFHIVARCHRLCNEACEARLRVVS